MRAEPARRLALEHPRGRTSILIGVDLLQRLGEELPGRLAAGTAFAVSSPPILELHGERLRPLQEAAGSWRLLEVEDGEGAKSVAAAERLWRRMLAAGGKRDSRVVAFGGGSVGDLAGFVAGTFLRGVELWQIPTTLLAQVDAAIGGKTAINLPEAKNSVGVFHHPEVVICDARLLETLPEAELRSGLLEVVKIAAMRDRALLARLESDLERLAAGEAEALAPLVAEAVRAKIEVVAEDPGESGPRRLLNFGHTLGHALETTLDYRRLRHGEAVAYGMLFALRLAESRGLAEEEAARLRELIRRFRLPPLPPLEPEPLLALMGRDKKARERGLAWVLPARLGEGSVDESIPEQEVARRLAEFLAAPQA